MAVHALLCLIETMAFIDTVFHSTQSYLLMYESNQTDVRHSPGLGSSHLEHPVFAASSSDLQHHQTTVHHFARHGLCNHFEGKKHLYRALKTKFCGMTLTFTAKYVLTVCNEKGHALDELVSELFDLDGDGFVAHYEKNEYR